MTVPHVSRYAATTGRDRIALPSMSYRLILVTHGRHARDLEATVRAFFKYVTPAPSSVHVACDGYTAQAGSSVQAAFELAAEFDSCPWTFGVHERPQGFCANTREAWNGPGANGPHAYVFWLEHDFVVTRAVDLYELAATLEREPRLAQMALMRQAVNATEKAAGGLYESRAGEYTRRMDYCEGVRVLPDGAGSELWAVNVKWLEHRSFLTTNPSLMRRRFLEARPWPDYPAECEGRFGIDLVLEGYSFGAWGEGEPWCQHIGDRDGFGY